MSTDETLKPQKNTLLEGVLWKGIIRYALPLMISFVIQQLYNTVDTAIVGRFAGSDALAAVGSTNSLVNLLVGVFLGVANGTGVVFGTYYGANDAKSMKRVLDTAVMIAAIAGALLTAVGVVLAPMMLGLINCPESIIGMAAVYLRIFFSGMIMMLLYNVGGGIILASGDSRSPLIYLAISGFVNFVLDYVFVAIFHWGVGGAAFATVLAQLLSAVLIFFHLIKRFPEEYRLIPSKMKWDGHMAGQIMKISIPCAIQSAMFDIANLIIQSFVNSHGATVIAAMTAYNKIDAFTFILTRSFSMTASTLSSQCLGACEPKRSRTGIRLCMAFSMSSTVVLAAVYILFGRTFLKLFTDDAAVLDHGVLLFRTITPLGWTYAVSEIIGGGIRGAGRPGPVTAITAITICGFRILWLSTVCTFLTDDIRFVYLCYPLSWTLCNIVMVIYYRTHIDKIYRPAPAK